MFKKIRNGHPVFGFPGNYNRYVVTQAFLDYFQHAISSLGSERAIELFFDLPTSVWKRVFCFPPGLDIIEDQKDAFLTIRITSEHSGKNVEGDLKYSLTENSITLSSPNIFFAIDDEEFQVLLPEIPGFDKEGLDEKFRQLIKLALQLCFFMDVAEITEEVVLPKTKKKIHGCKYSNKSGTPVRFLTSTYLKTIIRTEGFKVRGHWRWQPFGKDRKDRKLIFINTYEKKGYIRRADRITEEKN